MNYGMESVMVGMLVALASLVSTLIRWGIRQAGRAAFGSAVDLPGE